MIKFVKTQAIENEYDNYDVCVRSNSDVLTVDEMCELFGHFLRACGYSIGEILHNANVPGQDEEQ